MIQGLGFVPEQVVETILTTITHDGKPNAAPMGVWVKPRLQLTVRPFVETQTANNLAENPEAVINITDDSRIFFNTAFKKEISEEDAFWFEPAQIVKAPRLRGMLGYIEITVEPSKEKMGIQEQEEFECRVQRVDAPVRPPTVYSRARFAAIECVIHATRIRVLHEIDPVATEKLLTSIQEHHMLVQRIAPNSVHADVIDDILQLIHKWVYWL